MKDLDIHLKLKGLTNSSLLHPATSQVSQEDCMDATDKSI